MVPKLDKIVASSAFNRLILVLILISGALVGLETYPQFGHSTSVGRVFLFVQDAILWMFVVEIVLKIGACGAKPWQYFHNPWNVFDFIIVAVCLLPYHAEFAMVFRMARLLRSLRLLTHLPKMQVLVNALLRSIPSLGYVGILLLLHFYIYAVMGTILFSHNDPIRFGRLQSSMMTLFEVLTLEGWNDVFNTQALGSDVTYDAEWKELTEGQRTSLAQPKAAAGYFVSFIMLGTMIMLNLFTGVIVNSMQESQADLQARPDEVDAGKKIDEKGYITLREEFELVATMMREISANVAEIKSRTEQVRRTSSE